MLTEAFQCGDILGTVKRLDPQRAAFNRALYLVALGKMYPLVKVSVDGMTSDGAEISMNGLDISTMASMTIYSQMSEFVELATRIGEMHNAPFEWPAPTAKPDAIDAAFQFFLDAPDVWDEVRAAIKRLDNPNGTKAGLLTDEQQQDFLSESSVGHTSNS